VNHPKATHAELVGNLVARDAGDAIARFFSLKCQADPHREGRNGRPRRLSYGNGTSRHAGHLNQTSCRVIEVVKPVMDIDHVDGAIPEWKVLDVGYDRNDRKAVSLSPFACTFAGTHRNVRRYDRFRTRARKELRVHA
jgi:hypothetical protein